MNTKTIIEPFRIKMTEPIKMTTRKEREAFLSEAGYNPFLLKSENVLIDLLTDSGTGAMSAAQWAGIMLGDESYAGSPSFYHFKETVQDLTGFKNIIPTHQGRAAEKILFSIFGEKKKFIPSNAHFDTTRANIEFAKHEATDLPCKEAKDTSLEAPFKGNMDVSALENFIKEKGRENIPLVMLTITNNTGGGQPVSLENIKQVSAICKKNNIPLFLDACRFAENAYFIKLKEKGQQERSVKEISQEIFSLADGATMSGKKDGLVNMGGFLALNNDSWAEQARNLLILTEGFPTYGGLSGRDLEAYAIGLKEVVNEDYLKYRIRSVQYTGEKLTAAGVPIMLPTGGHAVYLDALKFLPHIKRHEFPGQALSCQIYIQGGIRGCEIGSVMFNNPINELVRLALPRRVYTQSHMDYVVEVIIEVFKNKNKISGYKMTYQAPTLRHFTAQFKPL
ncbi:MAG: tryptophanase [Oligoflexia bacterium]|nr:tryptophanase [Oligoflexia bacterium]